MITLQPDRLLCFKRALVQLDVIDIGHVFPPSTLSDAPLIVYSSSQPG